jgi:hypothetical protein
MASSRMAARARIAVRLQVLGKLPRVGRLLGGAKLLDWLRCRPAEPELPRVGIGAAAWLERDLRILL